MQNNLSPIFTVSELATRIKITLEDVFGYVRIRGEVSGLKKHSSGHLYFSIKDDQALISAVSWRGMVAQLDFVPEDGMEIIATGRVTTYGGRSQYQLIVQQVELAGVGALLKLLEDRRKKLLKEGLFDRENKQKIPFLPNSIGVITSPTGAVIRDIIHRISDRFPVPVVLWPVAVQGEGAATQIEAAIKGFQGMSLDGSDLDLPFPKPDLIIVARGGGSLEDLWCFNEENVVRAVATCSIPIITAVGHETDTTLVDLAADVRAPTPTGAAEIAVPVRADLLATLLETKGRLTRLINNRLENYKLYLKQLSRPLAQPTRLLENREQNLDDLVERLPRALKNVQKNYERQWNDLALRLRPLLITRKISTLREKLEGKTRLLESLSYKDVLRRGFAYVCSKNGKVVPSRQLAQKEPLLTLTFHDGSLLTTPTDTPSQVKKPTRKKSLKKSHDQQGSLFKI